MRYKLLGNSGLRVSDLPVDDSATDVINCNDFCPCLTACSNAASRRTTRLKAQVRALPSQSLH
jgi:hypothetical protein